MKITRKEIIKAIRIERLVRGKIIDTQLNPSTGEYERNDTCKVCAVGAVLRQTGIESSQLYDKAYSLLEVSDIGDDGDLAKALKDRNYLAALSIKFEKIAKKNRSYGPKTRESLIRFVKRHFPKQFETVGKL